MTEAGLQDVLNPSELFMSNEAMTDGLEGSAVSVVLEGTRPLLAEIQCLVSGNTFSRSGKKGNDGSSEGDAVIRVNPKRAADGFPLQRLLLICAVIEKRLGFSLYTRDVYLNVVGGLRVFEPSADLAVAVTIVSSLTGVFSLDDSSIKICDCSLIRQNSGCKHCIHR